MFPVARKASRPARPEAGEVIVTGVGTDPEKAKQNAFSQAIEQTVGAVWSMRKPWSKMTNSSATKS